MSTQGLEAIDHTVHLTHEWINELADRLDWGSHRSALRLLRATLRQLRDHLNVDAVAQLSAQLPLLIRGMYFEGWVPKATPVKERSAKDFLEGISAHLDQTSEYRGAADVTTVFTMLNKRLSRGEVEDLRAALSEDIRALWPAP